MMELQSVSYKQVYDLVFRARNARLNATAYVLPFEEWVKAGVAYNTRGFELMTRKISMFGELYNIMEEARNNGADSVRHRILFLEEALGLYYADIFNIYQDHLRSKHDDAKLRSVKTIPGFGDLLVLPSFDGVPELKELFPCKSVNWMEYQCQRVSGFLESINSSYLKPDSGLYHCMALMYDYGMCRVESGVLLEVILWDKIV